MCVAVSRLFGTTLGAQGQGKPMANSRGHGRRGKTKLSEGSTQTKTSGLAEVGSLATCIQDVLTMCFTGSVKRF